MFEIIVVVLAALKIMFELLDYLNSLMVVVCYERT